MIDKYIKTPNNSDYLSDFLVLPEGLDSEEVIDIFEEYLAPMRLSRKETYEHMGALLDECSFVDKVEYGDEYPLGYKSNSILIHQVEISI